MTNRAPRRTASILPATLPSSDGELGHERAVAQFLTVDELAQVLRVPKATVYRWRSTGDGPKGYAVGRYVRFRWTDVEAWLEERGDNLSPDC